MADKDKAKPKTIVRQKRMPNGQVLLDGSMSTEGKTPSTIQNAPQATGEEAKLKEQADFSTLIDSLTKQYEQLKVRDDAMYEYYQGQDSPASPSEKIRWEIEVLSAAPELMGYLEQVSNLTKKDLLKLLALSKGILTRSRVRGKSIDLAFDKSRTLAKGKDNALTDNFWLVLDYKIDGNIRKIVADSKKYQANEIELMVITRVLYGAGQALVNKKELTNKEYKALTWPVRKVMGKIPGEN
jgi:hypothetical protein